MKQHIENLLHAAIEQLQSTNELPATSVHVQVDATKDKQHGDFASNIALILAKPVGKKPREIAERLRAALPPSSYVTRVEIAGPGFINFFLSSEAHFDVVKKILAAKENYGRSEMGRHKRILLEFVSTNPTGPLHVGHGRHGAFGSIVGNLLEAVGFIVYREYYVNDAGRQMNILAVSVWLRYLQAQGLELPFPANAYQGQYVMEIAESMTAEYGKKFVVAAEKIFSGLPLDEPQGGDKEKYIDAVIERAKSLLGPDFQTFFTVGLNSVLKDIREDLGEFGVQFQNWFSEKKFVSTGSVSKLIDTLKKNGHVYEQEGALWFRATDFGDEKDRVLIRANGEATYFGNDAAYHINKFERGFDLVVDIVGADHHGYMPRIKALIQACGINPERLMPLFVQFVTLYRGGEQVKMSTRGGHFVTLRELRQEVGNDVARFFYVMRKSDQHIDFDLDLAKQQSNENPVYYVQYAHARICSVLKQKQERQLDYVEAEGVAHLALLTEPHEQQLLNTLARYPDIISHAALHYEPHVLTHYLRELATAFHAYYNSAQFLVEEVPLRNARLTLILAVKQVLVNGLTLLGVTTPETM